MIKRYRICALRNEIMRMSLIAVALLFAIHNAVGQDQSTIWVRPFAYRSDVDTTIMVFTYDSVTTKRWIPGTNKSKQDGYKIVTDTTFYLLPSGVYLPTTKEDWGDMLYDNELLPFNDVILKSYKVSQYGDRKKLTEIPPLDVELVYQRTSYQFKDTLETASEYQMFRDSVIGVHDTAYLIVKSDTLIKKDTSIRLLLVVNNKDVLFDDTIVVGNPYYLDTAMIIQRLGLSQFVSDFTLPMAMPVPRIMVGTKGRTISFIKEIHTEKKIDKTTKIPESPSNHENNLWLWIFIGAVVLLGALVTFLLIKKPEFLFKKKESRKFDFDFEQIDDVNNVEKVINKLREFAHQDGSLSFIEVEGKKHSFSFYINQDNANRFVLNSSKDSVGDNTKDASQASGFYQTLVNYIDGLYAEHPDCPKVKEAKETLTAIDVLVAKLSKKEQVLETPETYYQNLGQGKSNEALLNEVLELRKELEELQKYKTAIEDLAETFKNSRKEKKVETKVDEIVNKLKRSLVDLENLESSITSWVSSTKFANPEQAKEGIASLTNQIQDLSDTIMNLQNNPKSFENKQGYGELAKLIKDAREKNNNQKDLEDHPNKIHQDTPAGKLIRMGWILEQCMANPNKICEIKVDDGLEVKNAKGVFDKNITESPLAIQVKKGKFLDDAKNNVKLISTGQNEWLKDSELLMTIGFVDNPESILKSKRQTDTELYKLLDELKSIIAQNATNGTPIEINSLKSRYLKQQMNNITQGYNHYLDVIKIAKQYGSENYDTSALEPVVRQIFDNATRYLKFELYQNYWKNVVRPLLAILETLYTHDEKYNTRALMFYCSQFYSIACILNEIYGEKGYPTKIPKLNVKLFNTPIMPPPSQYGFPLLDVNIMKKECEFDYRGAEGEDDKVTYLKQYKPLPFIFINSYYTDDKLS